MGNKQDTQRTDTEASKKQTLTLSMYVVEYREHEHVMKAEIERINTDPQFPVSLMPQEHQKTEHFQKRQQREYMRDVKRLPVIVNFEHNQIQSEIQLLSLLSMTLCSQLSGKETSCWFKLKDVQLKNPRDILSLCQIGVDDIAFGTLETAASFVASASSVTDLISATAYELEILFRNRKIRLLQLTEDQLFSLEIENRHMHHIVHVVRRENHLDVYFQLRQPPLIYECINVDVAEENRRYSRRSCLPGISSEEIGRCDVLRVSFNASVEVKHLHEVFSNLFTADSPYQWEFRFAWIEERKTHIAVTDETELGSFAVLYASKVLLSVGLRCQLINCSKLLRDLPVVKHEESLYDLAQLYEREPEHYLIDRKEAINRRKPRGFNPNHLTDVMMLLTVVLTPTRIIFQRPSAGESNRVFRSHFSGDRAEYVMKVHFRDEDVQSGVKNLHFISLLSWKGSLDDQVL